MQNCIGFVIIYSLFLGYVHSKSICKLPNTGTVLFRNIDAYQQNCWNVEEIALLYTRRAMMELIPRQIPHNIPLIMEYIQICLTTLREQVRDKKVYHYMFAALVDTFGGYLQSYGIPLMHEAYYEGYVSYDNAVEFHRLQDNFKDVLMTNGEGWTAAMEVKKQLNRILPLKLPSTTTTHPCSLLLRSSYQDCENNSIIYLPILDDSKQPNSIAIPFKTHALYNLKSRSSYDILIKYYIESSKCISQFNERDKYQLDFDKSFSDWLKVKVVPHLKENVWFVGFSNALRIIETIEQRGGLVEAAQGEERGDDSMFLKLENELQLTRTAYIAIIIIIVVSILLICLLYSALFKKCTSREFTDTDSSKEDSSIFDESDTTSLLSESGKLSSNSSGHRKPYPDKLLNSSADSGGNVSQNSRTGSEESRLSLTCGLGKGFKCCRVPHLTKSK